MTFDLQRIFEDKRALRRDLASRSVAEKLALLEALRERTLTIRQAAARQRAEAQSRQSPAGTPGI